MLLWCVCPVDEPLVDEAMGLSTTSELVPAQWCKEIANGYEFTVTSFDSLEPKVSPPHHHCPWLRCA